MPNKFSVGKGLERRFAIELRKVARIIGGIIATHVDGSSIRDQGRMMRALSEYSEALGAWADRVVGATLGDVNRANKRAWESSSAEIKRTTEEQGVGPVMRLLQERQVHLIKNLPLESGLRAQELAREASFGGQRAAVVAQELARSGEVTESRATLIARTEIAKANAALTQARAAQAGATHYIWRTAEDGDVRSSHEGMNGRIFRFDDPPEVEDEGRHGPGEIYNCRCFAEPIIGEQS